MAVEASWAVFMGHGHGCSLFHLFGGVRVGFRVWIPSPTEFPAESVG